MDIDRGPPRLNSHLLSRKVHGIGVNGWFQWNFADRACGNRQKETEDASGVRRIEFQSPTVRFGAPFSNRQAEASAPHVTRTPLVNSVKPVEDFVPVFGRNPGTTIPYLDAGHERIR